MGEGAERARAREREREREREQAPLALGGTRPHAVGCIGGCHQIQGGDRMAIEEGVDLSESQAVLLAPAHADARIQVVDLRG